MHSFIRKLWHQCAVTTRWTQFDVRTVAYLHFSNWQKTVVGAVYFCDNTTHKVSSCDVFLNSASIVICEFLYSLILFWLHTYVFKIEANFVLLCYTQKKYWELLFRFKQLQTFDFKSGLGKGKVLVTKKNR